MSSNVKTLFGMSEKSKTEIERLGDWKLISFILDVNRESVPWVTQDEAWGARKSF